MNTSARAPRSLSAYVQPVAERYLTRLADGVRGAGFHGQLYVLQSNTGVDTVEGQADSDHDGRVGPASGFWGLRSSVA